jgi:predicted RNase H-like HicB family nuclease
MSKYEICIYWSDEDECYLAEMPELAGCMADGATREEAIHNIEIVADQWIATARSLGRPIPEPKRHLASAGAQK